MQANSCAHQTANLDKMLDAKFLLFLDFPEELCMLAEANAQGTSYSNYWALVLKKVSIIQYVIKLLLHD